MSQTQLSYGGYVRHRDRMVQESVFQDLQDTLIACRWMAGTTRRKVVDPFNPVGWSIVTTTDDQVLPLVGVGPDDQPAPVTLIDYFPEAGGNDDEEGKSRKTEMNTLACDTGVPQEAELLELGSNLMSQAYVFTLAFYANSDAVAMAMMNDLRDRYMGRLVSDDHLNLYNFNDPGFTDDSPPVVRMEVDSFRYSQNADTVSPWEVTLYFAELVVTDYVDPAGLPPAIPAPPDPDPDPEPEPEVDMLVIASGPPQSLPPGIGYLDSSTGDIYGADINVTVGTIPESGTNTAIDPASGDVYQEEN